MEPKELQTLGELFDRDLAGWRIARCHFLERAHGLMGTFPALVAETGEVVVTLDEETLERVKECLPPRGSKVTRLTVVIHPESGTAFSLLGREFEAMTPLCVLTREAVDALCEKEDAFRWSPGLFGG